MESAFGPPLRSRPNCRCPGGGFFSTPALKRSQVQEKCCVDASGRDAVYYDSGFQVALRGVRFLRAPTVGLPGGGFTVGQGVR